MSGIPARCSARLATLPPMYKRSILTSILGLPLHLITKSKDVKFLSPDVLTLCSTIFYPSVKQLHFFQSFEYKGKTIMLNTYCNICQENDRLVPATIEYRVQREDDADATHYVRCCSRHQEQGQTMAELMKRNMSPATISSTLLNASSEQPSAS